MKKSLLSLFFGGIASFSYASTATQETKIHLGTDEFTKSVVFKLENSITGSETSLNPPRKKRRGSPFRSGTGGKKGGGKVGACAKKRRH